MEMEVEHAEFVIHPRELALLLPVVGMLAGNGLAELQGEGVEAAGLFELAVIGGVIAQGMQGAGERISRA